MQLSRVCKGPEAGCAWVVRGKQSPLWLELSSGPCLQAREGGRGVVTCQDPQQSPGLSAAGSRAFGSRLPVTLTEAPGPPCFTCSLPSTAQHVPPLLDDVSTALSTPYTFPSFTHLSYLCPVCMCTQSCLTLCDPMVCSPPGSSVLWDSPSKNTGVGCHALLQGIFLTFCKLKCTVNRRAGIWVSFVCRPMNNTCYVSKLIGHSLQRPHPRPDLTFGTYGAGLPSK